MILKATQLLSILLITCVLTARSQNPAILLKLRSGDFELTENNGSQFGSANISDWPGHLNSRVGIVSLKNYPTDLEWSELELKGIHKLEIFPSRSFLVSISEKADFSALNGFSVIGYSPFQWEMKTSINQEAVPVRAKSSRSNILVNIHPISGTDMDGVSSQMQHLGFKVEESRNALGFITIECKQSDIQSICELGFVQFVDWKYDFGAPENYTGRTLHRTNFISPENTNGINYDGSGISVMLQDDGFIGPHIDHEGRIIEQFWATSDGDHGDHVAGTINGAGNLNPYNEGQAKGSDIYVYKAAPEYQGFDSIVNHYTSKQIVITSTSYSNGCNAGYTALARTMDEQIHDMQNLIHVFSAGNSGTSNCGYGAGNTWGNITGGHKVGKNTITVANLDEDDVVVSSSSRGPAHDGRIKPDISAKGTNVTSTLDGNTYGVKSGTSMSCPGVSGTLAVLYEAFDDVQGDLPKSGLMKAIVLNTADDLGNVGPDFIHGWGRINARKAYEVIANLYFSSGSVADGDSVQFTLIVPTNKTKARVMLYWMDPEASVNASTALINDLDLTITDPSSTIHLPYLLDHTPSISALSAPAIPGVDHLNNMEQIEFFNPVSGNYLVKIKGFDVPSGPQEYFVVYWFESEDLTLTYPVGGESLVPFNTEKIRWDSPDTAGTAMIEYSPDGGSTWNTLVASTPVALGYYNWNVPNLATGNIKIRINYSGQVVTSDVFSIIQTPSNLTVEFSCPDSIGLSWTAASSANGYTIHRLGNKYMEEIGISETTEFTDTLSNPLSDKLWYSVSSLGANGAVGKRMVAVQKAPGIFNCTINDDAGITSISPTTGSLFACHGDSVPVTLKVRNHGVNPIVSLSASYVSSDGQTATETFTPNIAPNTSTTIIFNTLYEIPATSSNLTASVSVSNDGNPYNDSLVVSYHPQTTPAVQAIWGEDFESFTLCGIDPDCGVTSCEMLQGWVNELNGETDEIDWRTNAGSTASQNTGPNEDHTTGNSSGKYLYLESSGSCNQVEAFLTSPCIDLINATEPFLTFWYSMYGADMGTLYIDVFDGQEWDENVYSISGNQGFGWNFAEVDLSDFIGKIVNVRFRGRTGNDYRSDMAIDDILISHPPVANFAYAVQEDGLTINFTDLSYASDSTLFELGEGTIIDSMPSSYTYPQIQVYTTTQRVYNEIGADTMIQLITTLGNYELGDQQTLIFPNPANNYLFARSLEPISSFVLITSDCRIVKKFEANGETMCTMNISSLSDGVYFLQFENGAVEKISITH
jgi:hypothetical protein